jgi:hypothetical protein
MNPPAFKNNARAAIIAIALAVVFAQLGGDAQAQPVVSLPYSNSYLVTGNFVANGIDLPPQGAGSGFVKGTINFNASIPGSWQVPPNAEILSAFLYLEIIVSNPADLTSVRFREKTIDLVDNNLVDDDIVRKSFQSLTLQTAACFSSGGGPQPTYTMYKVRVDVRNLLALQYDATGRSTGRRLVNDADILSNHDQNNVPYTELNTVSVPERGTGNLVPQAAGGSLLVVYRTRPELNINTNTFYPMEPLRRILLFDGIAIIPDVNGATLSQRIPGIYQSSATKSARLTYILGHGQPNGTERLFFNGTQNPQLIDTDPFQGTSNASDRGWTTATYDVSTRMPGLNFADGFGETVTTTVKHVNQSPYDCLSWGAIVFSTAVADVDSDGIPDGIEDSVGGLTLDANGDTLPDVPNLSSWHKDILIEMDAMWTDGIDPETQLALSYGSPAAPYSPNLNSLPAVPHNHMPPPASLRY